MLLLNFKTVLLDLNIPAEYLSFHNPMLSIPSPSQLDFDIFTPTFADPTECRSFTFLLRDPNPVIPFKLKDHLISCFFTHYHRHHPILLLPDFFELCYPVCRHPSYLMNAIYAFGSIYSRHPVILNGETSRTITTTTLGNSFARVASKQLREVVIDDLDDNERPNYIIACILLSIYQMGMNFDQKRDHFSGMQANNPHFFNIIFLVFRYSMLLQLKNKYVIHAYIPFISFLSLLKILLLFFFF